MPRAIKYKDVNNLARLFELVRRAMSLRVFNDISFRALGGSTGDSILLRLYSLTI